MFLAYLLLLVFASCFNDSLVAINIPSKVTIGGIFPKFKFPNDSEVNFAGVEALSGFLMAIRDVNSKNDGIYDEILPNTTVEFAARPYSSSIANDITSSMELASSVFNGSGVSGVVLFVGNDDLKFLSSIFTGYGISQISIDATYSSFSFMDSFPYLYRMKSSDEFDSFLIASIIQEKFPWRKVSTFSSNDAYGSSCLKLFLERSRSLQIEVVSTHEFGSNSMDFYGIVNSAISQGTRIFVFFMNSEDAGRLIEQGHHYGLFVSGTQIIGTSKLVISEMTSVLTLGYAPADLFKGLLVVSPHNVYDNGSFGDFVSRWRAQNNTMFLNSNGSIDCSTSYDSDGGFELFGDSIGTTHFCAGLQYGSFSPNGSDLSPYAIYAYDATLTLLYGFHRVLYEFNYPEITSVSLKKALIENVTFVGASGRILFEKGDPFERLGFGSRVVGQRFDLMNFQFSAFQSVGNFEMTSSTALSWFYDKIDSIVYNTDLGDIPPDRPTPITNYLNKSVGYLLITLALLNICLMVLFSFSVYSARKMSVFGSKYSELMIVMLFGSLLASIRIYLGSLNLSEDVCIARIWFYHMGFLFCFGPQLLLIWSHYLSRDRSLTKYETNMIFLGLFLSFLVLLLLLSFKGGPHVEYKLTDLGLLQDRRDPYCVCSNPIYSILLLICEGSIVLRILHLNWLLSSNPADAVISKKFAIGLNSVVFLLFSVCIIHPLFCFLFYCSVFGNDCIMWNNHYFVDLGTFGSELEQYIFLRRCFYRFFCDSCNIFWRLLSFVSFQ